MKKISTIVAAMALLAAPTAIAADEPESQARKAETGSHIKRLPDLTVVDPVASKPLQNADNADLDPELRAILEEAEAAESTQD